MSDHRPAVWGGGKKSLKAYAEGGTTSSSDESAGEPEYENENDAPVEATDAAAELADELGVDLATVATRTGKGGKITVWDVREAAGLKASST